MSQRPPRNSETVLRVVALGALYAAAMVFAIAFSPANGFVHPEKLAHLSELARPALSLTRPE